MRNVLSWLLILLLPIAGLFGGMWLVPVAKPLWQREFEYCINVLGFVNEGKTLLAAEVSREGQQVLMGIDPSTGDEQFRQPLTREHLQAKATQIREAALSDDGQYVVFPAEELNSYEQQIMLYDWKRHEVVKRFRVASEEFVNTVVLKQGILTAVTNKEVMQWKPHTSESAVAVTKRVPNQTGAWLSGDSSLLIQIYLDTTSGPMVAKITDLRTMEHLKRELVVQPIGIIRADQDGMSLIESIPKTSASPASFVVREYRFNQDRQLQATGREMHLDVVGWFRGSTDAVIIVESVNLRYWRWALTKILGKDITQRIPFLSSKACQVNVYDRVTMEKLHVLSLPEAYKGRGFRFELHRQDAGLALWTERKIDYWQLQPPTRFLPLLGLLIGSLLSLLLIVRRYRVARHRFALDSLSPPASSGDSRLSAL